MRVPVAFSVQGLKILVNEHINVWLNTSIHVYCSAMHGSIDTKGSPAILLDLFLWFKSDYLATDPRDRIYGLLGMLQKKRGLHMLQSPVLEVDYRKSLVDVYCDFVRFLMQSTKTPQYITKVWGRECVKSGVHILPSWVPDFSIPQINTWAVEMAATTGTCFDASKAFSGSTLPFTVEGNLLRLYCIIFSEIARFGECIDDGFLYWSL